MADPKYDFTFENDPNEKVDDAAAWKPGADDPAAKGAVQKDDEFEIVIADEEPPKPKPGAKDDPLAELPPIEPDPIQTGPDPEVARMREEIRQMRAQMAGAQSQDMEARFQAAEAGVAAKIADAEARLQAAIEAGESAVAAKAQVEIGRLTADERILKERIGGAREQAKRAAEEASKAPAADPADMLPPELSKWLGRNAWYHDKSGRYARHQKVAQDVDAKLADEGFNKYHPRYYQELDKRIREQLKVHPTDKKPETPSPAPATRNGGSLQSGTSRRIVLTRRDLEVMESLNMNVKDPKALKAFADEKRSMAAAGGKS